MILTRIIIFSTVLIVPTITSRISKWNLTIRSRRYRHTLDSLLSNINDPDTSTCHYERNIEVYTPEDLKGAHNGLFRDIEWTREERLKIADLHSTHQYHLLGPLLKTKLDSLGVDNEYRRRIAEFFTEHYPPKVVRKLHSNDSKCRVSCCFG